MQAMQAIKQSSNPTLCIAFIAPACKHVVHQSVALLVPSRRVGWSEAAMASRSKQASEGKKAAKLVALARAAWNSHVESSSKQRILQFLAENPTYCTQVDNLCPGGVGLHAFLVYTRPSVSLQRRTCLRKALRWNAFNTSRARRRGPFLMIAKLMELCCTFNEF